jgi:uncharacterized iron-regulated membrane protein
MNTATSHDMVQAKPASRFGSMDQETDPVAMAICCALILLALVGFISYWTSGLLRGDIDGLLLLSICFLVAGIFSGLLLLMLRKAGWLKLPILGQARTSVHDGEVADGFCRRTTGRTVKISASGWRLKSSS